VSPERYAQLLKGVGILQCRNCDGQATPVDVAELDATHLLVCYQPDCLCFRQQFLVIDVEWIVAEEAFRRAMQT